MEGNSRCRFEIEGSAWGRRLPLSVCLCVCARLCQVFVWCVCEECVYIHTYTYMYICIYIYMYTHTYVRDKRQRQQRERGLDRDRERARERERQEEKATARDLMRFYTRTNMYTFIDVCTPSPNQKVTCIFMHGTIKGSSQQAQDQDSGRWKQTHNISEDPLKTTQGICR